MIEHTDALSGVVQEAGDPGQFTTVELRRVRRGQGRYGMQMLAKVGSVPQGVA